jgi:tetratricopeptide (TPR) repeat protein
VQARLIFEQHSGKEHPDTARSMNNLASLYFEQGKDKQAEPLYLQALSIYESLFGSSRDSEYHLLHELPSV